MTCQRCDASAVPRSVTVGPYGSAVWWLSTLYSSSYGHHGLSPCSTYHGRSLAPRAILSTRERHQPGGVTDRRFTKSKEVQRLPNLGTVIY